MHRKKNTKKQTLKGYQNSKNSVAPWKQGLRSDYTVGGKAETETFHFKYLHSAL